MSAVRNRHIPKSRDFALTASPCRCHRKDTRNPQANDVPPDNANTLPHQKTWRRTPGGTWVCRFSIWLAWEEQYQNTLDWQAASHYIRCRRSKGDKPLVVTWADEHDLFIANLKSIEAKQDYTTQERHDNEKFFENDGGQPLFEVPMKFEDLTNEDSRKAGVSPDWVWAKITLRDLENERSGLIAPNHLLY